MSSHSPGGDRSDALATEPGLFEQECERAARVVSQVKRYVPVHPVRAEDAPPNASRIGDDDIEAAVRRQRGVQSPEYGVRVVDVLEHLGEEHRSEFAIWEFGPLDR